jgi:chitinase
MKQTRISIFRVGVLLLSLILVAATVRWFAARGLQRPPDPVSPTFAGYVDVTATPPYPFESPADAPQSDVILAFIVAGTAEPCTPTWGTYYTLEAAQEELDLERRIAQLREVGGSVAVSFGGMLNDELAVSCTDVGQLEAAYRAVIDRYQLSHIDLDIEGPALTDVASQQRRATAIAQLQKSLADDDRPLNVWVTLPVDTNGLTSDGVNTVRTLTDAGVRLSGVNGMAMNFGGSKLATDSMFVAVRQASEALQAQVAALIPGSVWRQVGITVMIGQNDIPGEVFTIEDAKSLNQFALQTGPGLLSMWSLNRDSTCQPPLPKTVEVVQTDCSGVNQDGQNFADILAAGATGELPSPTATPPPPTPEQAIVDDPETSPYPIWDPQGAYPGGTRVVWKRKVYKARYWTTGITPGSVPAGSEDPWILVGPVMPGDTPAPLPTLPEGTYPKWREDKAYVAGDRVQLDNVGYEAKWWTKGQRPDEPAQGASPWTLITP